MMDICFRKFGNILKTRNCLNIVLSQPNDWLYCGFVSCTCFSCFKSFGCVLFWSYFMTLINIHNFLF
jgi:hypothetical protein